MKKNKDYLTISSIIMIIYIIYFFLTSYKSNKFITKDTFTSVCNVVEVVLGLLGSIYFLYIANSDDNIEKHRKGILFFSIVFFITNIISGVLCFKVYKTLVKSNKKSLPKLDDIEQNKYISLISLVVCLILLFYVNKVVDKMLYNLLIYLIILIIMVFNYRKRLKRDFIEYKNNFSNYFTYSLKIWGLSLLTLVGVNLIISFLTGMTNASNQQALNEAIKNYPLLISFLTVIYAPIAEELMFRGVFKEFIKKKMPFIIISGIVFGLMHVIDDFTSYKELLYIFVYGTMGCYLAFLYYKTNNIFSNITFHFLQNTFATIVMLLMTYFM